MELILILLCVLLIVTLVGHGIWVLLAFLFRGGRPQNRRGIYEPTVSDDRAATARHLQRLRTGGRLDAETYSQVMHVLADDVAEFPRSSTSPPRKQDIAVTPRAIDEPGPAQKPAEPAMLVSPPTVRAVQAEHQRAESPSHVAPPPPCRPEPTPSTPRRPFTDVMIEFMAERNIRWGEIIGGLLILCCSTALVISLWSQIEAIPILKFVIFTTVTAALFGVGLFVHHRWKLPMTGHAILVISSLLVPLNLLAFAAFSRGEQLVTGWTLGIELPTIALFGWLTFLAGRVVMPRSPVLFAAGVVGLSFTSLIIPFVALETELQVVRAAGVPIGLYVVMMTLSLFRQARTPWEGDPSAKQTFLQLGVQTFASLIPCGLLAYASRRAGQPVHALSAIACAIAAPGLVTGAVLARRLAEKGSGPMRTAAMCVSLVAAGVMLLCVGLAWPVPAWLLPVLLINAVSMVALCVVSRQAVAHGLAAMWFAASWVLGVHWVLGHIPWWSGQTDVVADALLSAETGHALVAATAVCAALACLFDRRGRRQLALAYGAAGLAFALVSLALVTFLGFAIVGDPRHVSWVYLLHGAIAFLAAARMQSPRGSWIGCILIQMGIIQLLVYMGVPRQCSWPTAFLAGASVAAVAAGILRFSRPRNETARLYAGSVSRFAGAVSLAAAAWMACSTSEATIVGFGGRAAWLSVLWMVLAAINTWPTAFAGAQVAMVVATCAGIQHHLVGAYWYEALPSPLHDPWVWQAHLLAAAGLSLFWAGVRLAVVRQCAKLVPDGDETAPIPIAYKRWCQTAKALLMPHGIPADRGFTAALVLALIILAGWSVAPGTASEHGSGLFANLGQHGRAAGPGSWALALIVVATLGMHHLAGWRKSASLGIVLVAACATALFAARFEARHQVVDAYRWVSAGLFLAASVLLWLQSYWSGRASRPQPSTPTIASFDPARAALFLFVVMPVVIATATYSSAIAQGEATTTAGVSDVWLRISLLGPAAMIILTIIGYGLYERQPAFVVGAAALACVAVTETELALLGRNGQSVTMEFVVWLVQINTILIASIPIGWRHIQWLLTDRNDVIRYPRWLLLLGRSVIGLVLLLAVAIVWLHPQSIPAAVATAGTVWGILAVVLVEWALLATCRLPARTWQGFQETAWVLFGVGLLTCAVAPLDTGNWLCFHASMAAIVAAGWLRLGAGARYVHQLHGTGWHDTFAVASAQASGAPRIEHDLTCTKCRYNLRGLVPSGRCPECGTPISASLDKAVERLTSRWASHLADARTQTAIAVLLCTIAGTLFALRAVLDDPQRPWWSAGVLTGLSALCVALGHWAPRRAFASLGGITICLAASIWWTTLHWLPGAPAFAANVANLIHVNVVALTLLAVVWLFAETRATRQKSIAVETGPRTGFHHVVAIVLTATVSGLAAAALHTAILDDAAAHTTLLGWLAWIAAVVLVVLCAKDPASRHLSAGLYALGLAALVRIMASSGIPSRELGWAFSLLLAGYVLIATAVWRLRAALRPDNVAAPFAIGPWLWYVNGFLATISLLLSVSASWNHPVITMRMLVAVSPLLCAGAAWLAVRATQRAIMETCTAALLSVSAVLFAWVWIAPDTTAAWVHRGIGLVAAYAAVTILSSAATFWLARKQGWVTGISRCAGGAGVIAGLALLFVAYTEITAIVTGAAVPLATPAVIALFAALPVLIAGCTTFAVSDRLDPLRLRPAAKETYVYVAEALGGILILHVRFTMPWLFSGFFLQYWPILVILLAFAAVGAGEACRRYGQRVLARPLGHTGLFLPVLVLPELVIASSQVHYSIVLVTTGALYGVLAVLRRSVVMAALAGLSLTGSLWYLLYHAPGLAITQHPQLWFIPPACAALVAGHVNRNRLTEQQRTILNYACLLAVYLSSTADVFLMGVAQAPWLPLVLGGLSIVGLFLGFISRIRSFLLLSTGFLCLSLLTIVWHAAENLGWTWVWYVAGIVLGAAIITIFALFEKKRQEMRGWLEEVKSWEG
ncbi:MAG: hypothetical protein JXA69_12620 [Phycisphaerae bacterium]|nr:hypothetical protein [Phycisphaerae bacterium]